MRSKLSMLVLLVAALPAAAQSSGPAESARTLGGYRFIPSSTVEDPFINTSFQNFTGLAYANNVDLHVITVPTDPPTDIFSVRGDFLFVTADFDYQLKVHRRAALTIGGSGASRVGTTGTALLSQGVTALTEIRLGALVELWHNDKLMLTGSVQGDYLSGLFIDFLGFTKDIIEGDYRSAALVRDSDGFSFDAGLRAAWAVNHWSGITAIGQIGGTNIDPYDDELRWRVAANGSVDFGQRGNAPVGLSLSVDYDELTAATITAEYVVGAGVGVHYTGREDLNLALELGWSRAPSRESDVVVYPMKFGLSIRYFF
jgi:hypothetical protein